MTKYLKCICICMYIVSVYIILVDGWVELEGTGLFIILIFFFQLFSSDGEAERNLSKHIPSFPSLLSFFARLLL